MPSGDNFRPVPVNPDVLQMLADLQEPGEPDLLRELVTLFLRDAPERLRALHDALAVSDYATASRAAHSLKGSAATLGAQELESLSGIAEVSARAGDTVATLAALSALEREYEKVRGHLELLLATRPS